MNNPKMSCPEKKSLATQVISLSVPADAQWSEFVTESFINSHLPRIYYFAAMDCDHVTHMVYKMMPKIEVDFNIVNQPADGEPVDHFSYEEQGTLGLHLTLLLTFTPLFAFAIYKCVQHQKTFEMNHSPFVVIILALFFQLGNLFWKVIHLLMYSSNGKGIPFFDIVSLIC
jgi:Rhodopsin-like GPCR transmembrane domain